MHCPVLAQTHGMSEGFVAQIAGVWSLTAVRSANVNFKSVRCTEDFITVLAGVSAMLTGGTTERWRGGEQLPLGSELFWIGRISSLERRAFHADERVLSQPSCTREGWYVSRYPYPKFSSVPVKIIKREGFQKVFFDLCKTSSVYVGIAEAAIFQQLGYFTADETCIVRWGN